MPPRILINWREFMVRSPPLPSLPTHDVFQILASLFSTKVAHRWDVPYDAFRSVRRGNPSLLFHRLTTYSS